MSPRRIESPIPADVLFGVSSAMQLVAERVAAAAATVQDLLITGEPGTGRELVARVIHERARSAGPFITVDCAGTSADGLHELVIGVRPNGTAGQTARAKVLERISASGAIHQAQGGTLLIRNLTEMPAGLQLRLARVLRDREVMLADGRRVPVDIRAIGSADASADFDPTSGRIVTDLLRRLAFRIELPALRARKEDIPVLARHLIGEVCCLLGVPPRQLTEPAVQLLAELPWRGNINELRVAAEALASRGTDSLIRLRDVLAVVRLNEFGPRLVGARTLREARTRFEREYIAAVLEEHHGRPGAAARALGIQRPNLYRKLRALHLSRRSGSQGRKD